MNKTLSGDVDLSFIEPHRRALVKARLDAIALYEAEPSRKHASALAGSVGLQTAQFYNLVKSWRTLRDPAKLAGVAMPRGRRVDVASVQKVIIDNAIAGSPDASPEEVTRIAFDAGIIAGVAMPSREKVRRYVHANRPRRLTTEMAARGDLIVDHTVIEPPVSIGGGRRERPLATLIIAEKQNAIVSVELSRGTPSARSIASVLLETLAPMVHGVDDPSINSIALPHIEDPKWPELHKILLDSGMLVNVHRPGRYEHGQYAEALLGLRSEGIRLRPRLVEAGADRREVVYKGPKPSLSIEDARELVRARLGVGIALAGSLGMDSAHHHQLLRSLGKLASSYGDGSDPSSPSMA